MKNKENTIPKGWQIKTIDQVCCNLDNLRVPISKDKRIKGSIPYYGATGVLDYVSEYIFDEDLLLIGEDGADWSKFAESAYLIKGKSWVNNHAHVLKCKKINQVYLKEYLNFKDLNLYITGGTRGKLTKGILSKIPVAVPTPEEQKKIAEILSCVDEDIEKTDEMIKKTQKLKKGLMQEFFAKNKGNYTKIADLAEVFTGGTPNTTHAEYWGGDIKWMSSGEVNLRRVYNTKKTITQEGLDNSNARLLPTGTVMVALAGQGKTRGKVALLEVESTCNQSLAAIIAHPVALNNEFLFFNFEYRYEELRNISGGEGRAGLNLRIIKDILIPVPNMSEQKKIAEILSAVDDKIDIYKQIKSKLTQLKKGLMRDLLSGEVKVK